MESGSFSGVLQLAANGAEICGAVKERLRRAKNVSFPGKKKLPRYSVNCRVEAFE